MISRLVILPMAFWISSASALEYAPGVVWDRYADWTPGTTPGSSDGNADDDRNGNPTWLYANLQGGGDSAPPRLGSKELQTPRSGTTPGPERCPIRHGRAHITVRGNPR